MKSLYLLIIGTFAFIQVDAQYTFSTFVESYGTHVFATEIIANDYDGVSIWDDPDFEIELDFPFPVNGQEYSSIVQIGGGAMLMLTNGTSNTIFAYDSDLIDAELETPLSASIISHITVGEIGSRILKVQYENCGFYNAIEGLVAGDVTNRIDFQMWFYETGVFEMRFGPSSITNPILVHGGLGPLIFLAVEVDLDIEEAEFLAALSGDPSNPTFVLDPTIKGDPPALEDDPSNGRVYQFSPSTLNVGSTTTSKLKLWPSIADWQISVEGFGSDKTTYRIFDLSGQEQMTGQMTNGEKIDVSTLSEGMYLLRLDGHNAALKFIKL